MMDPPSLGAPEMWRYSMAGISAWPGAGGGDASGGAGSILMEQCGGSRRGRRKRKASAAVDNESFSSGNDVTDCEVKWLKTDGGSKAEAEANSGVCIKQVEQIAQPSEAPKQDFIHVRARRGQATDSHSLAERITNIFSSILRQKNASGQHCWMFKARREKISERMKVLQDLVPGCHKVIGKASVLDEIINYIQALQHQVEFLSMKLEAVNSGMNTGIGGFSPKDIS